MFWALFVTKYFTHPILSSVLSMQVLPFEDNICVNEPCLNFDNCISTLKFGNATAFVTSDTMLFRPIHPVNTFKCHCPQGFTGNLLFVYGFFNCQLQRIKVGDINKCTKVLNAIKLPTHANLHMSVINQQLNLTYFIHQLDCWRYVFFHNYR